MFCIAKVGGSWLHVGMANVDVNITTREVAEIARVDTSTVRRWVESGDLPSFTTPGGHHRFSRQYILARFSSPVVPSSPEVDGAAGVSFVST